MTRFAIGLLVLCTAAIHAGDAVFFCSGPDERYRSSLYQVESPDGNAAFVYYRENGWKRVPDKDGGDWPCPVMSADNSWVSLAARGEVSLRIRATGVKPATVELLPPRPGNSATLAADGSVRVVLQLAADHPGYYFVRINGAYGDKHPLFIFADPPESDVPAKGPGVHVFGPGVHDIGPHYTIKDGETVYLAPGSVVRGTITASGANVRICGRGILSGELLQEEWIRHKRGFVAKPKDARGDGDVWLPMIGNDDREAAHRGSTTVEGITIIDAPNYHLLLIGERFTVRNVKLLSWNYSTDGISGGPGLVEHCFFKVNDDVFPLYTPDKTLRNLVIWKQMNATVFQLGYGYGWEGRSILAERIDIIRDETETQCAARGIIGLTASHGCAFRDVRFQDITVHGDTLNLLAIDNLNHDTRESRMGKDITMRDIDLTLRRVTVTGTERGRWHTPFLDRQGQPMRSRLRTADPGRIRVLLEDVSINGVRLQSPQDFPNGLETQGDVELTFRAGAAQPGQRFFDSDGVLLHYTDEGTGEPVILVHGFATDQTVNWATLIPALRGAYRIVAFDHRGHGRSARPTGQGTYGRHMVEDIRRLMDHLHLQQAHLVGYSMGGLIVGKFLAEHPDRVRSAVIGGISCAEPDERWRGCMAALAGSLEAGRGLGPLFDYLGQGLEPARLQDLKASVPAAAEQACMAACVRQFPEFTVPDGRLADNVIPTLALIGDQDPFRAAVVRLKDRMGHLAVVTIPGADHCTAFSDPRFAQEIRRFLDAQAGP